MARKRHDNREVQLESGGKVTVGFDFSVFDLSGRDREFVNHLIDMINDFEAATKAAESRSSRSKSTSRSSAGPSSESGSGSAGGKGNDAA